MVKWTYDTRYEVTSPFGYRTDPLTGETKFHRGVDLVAAPANAEIYAFAAGEVLHAKEGVSGSGFGGYGLTVAIKDANGYLHCYAHLSAISAAVQQTVSAGQLIGRQGSTGSSTGPHLHYEVRTASSPLYGYTVSDAGVVDPTDYLMRLAEEEEEMTEAEKELLNSLKLTAEAQEKRIAALEAKHKMAIPAWAKEAVEAAVNAKLIDTPDGGSEDFYRLITVMHRNKLF